MRQGSTVALIQLALALGLLVTALSLSLTGTAVATNRPSPSSENRLVSVETTPPIPSPALDAQQEPARTAQSSNNLPAGAWIGIGVSLVFALLLLFGSLAYVLPRPRQR
jgi:hypothetical protein